MRFGRIFFISKINFLLTKKLTLWRYNLIMKLNYNLLLALFFAISPIFAQKSLNGFPKLTQEQLNLTNVSYDKDANAVILAKELMNKLNLDVNDRDVARVAKEKSEQRNTNIVAIKLSNGNIITGKESELLSASSAAILNAVKEISKIPDDEYLLSPAVLDGIFKMKKKTSYKTSYCLNLQEILIALSICSITNPIIEKIINNIGKLNGCEAHSSYIIEKSELNVRKNGIIYYI